MNRRAERETWVIPTTGECDLCERRGTVYYVEVAMEYRCEACHRKILREFNKAFNENNKKKEA